ncbi:hypothetical protein GRI97_10730 [Altererythrobacter xixiisoli]|uniref:Peptidase n=1 Tax=Croceibacterium xixiisoli TaxID=1476466 RepID=A0A6I4TYM0_9SPHN|nr:hypothetical protein [Croceibacterium xixiisoli]MXO99463.1 hypothetical protein [Croceibacterium xixiisoli]
MTEEATNLADTVILGPGDTGAGPAAEMLGGQDVAPAPDPALAPAPAVRAGAPERYELALGGMAMDAGLMAEAEPVLRELGLSNDEAGRFMPLAQSLIDRTADRTLQDLIDAGAQQRREWLDAYRADPEIGGARTRETEHLAARGLDALGFTAGHPFRAALSDSGFGNHPDMIRAFRKIGELVSEDGFARSTGGPAGSMPIEKRLYPND